MVLDASLFNTWHYKVRIKSKWSNTGCCPLLLLCIVAIEKGDFGSSLTTLSQWPSQLELLNTLTASLQRGKSLPCNDCPGYDSKQSDGEVPVMLEFWVMQSTPLLPSHLGLLRPGVVAPDRVLSVGQIELNCMFMLN